MWLKTFLILFLSFTFFVSCGHRIVKETGISGGKIKSIYVGGFKNLTFEPQLSMYVTDAFSSELVSLGLFEVNRSFFDAKVEGVIKKVTVRTQTVDKRGIAVEKNVEIEVDISLATTDKKFIRKWSLVENETYRSDDPNLEDYNKREAMKRAAAKMARRFSSLLFIEY